MPDNFNICDASAGGTPSSAVPIVSSGNGDAGALDAYSRGDHVHPTTGLTVEPSATNNGGVTQGEATVVMTTGVSANLHSILLPAGVWEVHGLAIATPASNLSTWEAGISVTSATLPTRYAKLSNGSSLLGLTNMRTEDYYLTFDVPTTVYLVARGVTGGTALSGTGVITAKRRA